MPHSNFLKSALLISAILYPCSAISQQMSQRDQQSGREAQSARAAEQGVKERIEADMRQIQKPGRYYNPDYFDKKLTAGQKKLLQAPAEDYAAHAELLRAERTGLVRLLPKGKYEFSQTVSVDTDPDKVLPILGGGAFYSFTKNTHTLGPWSEISLQQGYLVAGCAAESLGLLVSIGDVPVESVSVATPGVEFLTRRKPPKRYHEAERQRIRDIEGIREGGFRYSSILPAAANTTYVLRATAYKKQGRLVSYGIRAVYVPAANEYEGSDALIAFRILRLEKDESAIILWKRLQKFSTPNLDRQNRVGFKEIKQVIESEAPIGMSLPKVIAYLDSKGITHSGYQQPAAKLGEEQRAIVRAWIANVERGPFARYDMRIEFFFDDEAKLVERKMMKVKR